MPRDRGQTHLAPALRLVGAVLALALLGACGGTDTPAAPAPAAESEGHNEADARFAVQMIPFHRQSLMAAGLARRNDAGPRIQDLAARIEATQTPELRQLLGWDEAWSEEAGRSDPDVPGEPPGLLGPWQMRSLAHSRGVGFDQLFLVQMSQLHEGAVAVARQELAEGSHTGAVALAVAIDDAQTAELAEMRGLLTG